MGSAATKDIMRNRDRLGSFGQQFGGGFIDAPYVGWTKGYSAPDPTPEFEDLQRAVGIVPGSVWARGEALRLPTGQVVYPGQADYWQAHDHAMDKWADQMAYLLFRRPARRGDVSLGTYRSKRKATDRLREAQRRSTCEVCGGPMTKRSNAMTCSPKCRQTRSRRLRSTGKPALARQLSHTFVLGMDSSRGHKTARPQENIVNYAQELQTEADALARKKLARAFDGAELVAVLAALDVIAERNMAAATEWVSPSRSRHQYVPWTPDMVGSEVIYPRALSLMTEAVESAEAAGAIA